MSITISYQEEKSKSGGRDFVVIERKYRFL